MSRSYLWPYAFVIVQSKDTDSNFTYLTYERHLNYESVMKCISKLQFYDKQTIITSNCRFYKNTKHARMCTYVSIGKMGYYVYRVDIKRPLDPGFFIDLDMRHNGVFHQLMFKFILKEYLQFANIEK